MRPSNLATQRRAGNRQRGQTTTLVVLALGLFLLGAIGLAVDVSNWWFHHQMAQGAADAACTAGVMDLLSNASGGGGTFGDFPAGSPPASFPCSSAPGAATCQYAALNGYNGTGRTAAPSNDVLVSFPSSVPGLNVCSDTNPPPCIPSTTTVANPFIQVTVIDRVQTSFTGLLSGSNTRDVAGSAVCGVLQATAPVPIIVLNPTCPHAFQISGNPTLKIVGGPSRSVQVNSSNISCAAATTNSGNGCNSTGPTIDLSKGGKDFTGSEFAVVGQPKTAPSGFVPGTTGGWATGAPISDPYALVPTPDVPSDSTTDLGNSVQTGNRLNLNPGYVPYLTDGCPDHDGCIEYQPGLYHKSIQVKGYTAIFAPGIYYMKPTTWIDQDNSGSPGTGCLARDNVPGNTRYALAVDSNGVVRPSTAAGATGSGHGVMFYLTGSGSGSYTSVFFGSNAGHNGGRTIDPFVTINATCDGTAPPGELSLPSSVAGNVLLGQCTSKGTYLGSPSTDTAGNIRSLIFFQDRANADSDGQASMQGGGGLVLSGNMYFHNCNASGTGTGCSAPRAGYNAFLQFQGNSGGNTYVLGNVTADELIMSGNDLFAMSLNPNAIYNILKASLLQ
jgi:putative Flp pilus-assembly TadE/G-like protein